MRIGRETWARLREEKIKFSKQTLRMENIALAFNVKMEVFSIEMKKIEDIFIVCVKARMTAPNGRSSDRSCVM